MALDLAVFLAGAFVAAYVTGVAGFAFGIVAAAIWLHALTPIQATALIVAYALIVQGYAVWKLRRALNVRRLLPFVLGSAVGIPAGIAVLKWASASDLRIAVGLLIVFFSLYSLAGPSLPQIKRAGTTLDGAAGVINGLLGGATGLAGIVLVIWCAVRGWTRDEQRAVFQPAAVATFLMTIMWLGGAGVLTADVARLFLIGLPALIAGTWLGWKSYGRLDEVAFRKVVLGLLVVLGVTLVASPG
jgi:uncharacterized membrane protein YfcA